MVVLKGTDVVDDEVDQFNNAHRDGPFCSAIPNPA